MSTATKAKPRIKIHPLEDRVVIRPADEADAMRGGLYIPDTAKEKPTQGMCSPSGRAGSRRASG